MRVVQFDFSLFQYIFKILLCLFQCRIFLFFRWGSFSTAFFFDRCTKIFLDRKVSPDTVGKIEKQKLIISLPFVGKYSNSSKKKLSTLASSHLFSEFKISVVWKSSRTVRTLFPFKDRVPVHLCSKFLYRFKCDGCNSIYIGKSKRHFLIRAYEHLGLSYRTDKKYTYNNPLNILIIGFVHKENNHWFFLQTNQSL